MLNDKTILVTGGTGSFGNAFVAMTLKEFNPREIIIFSRDEMKQWEMAKHWSHDQRVRFVIGDVRDSSALKRVFEDVDYVVHAAATKIVPTAEYNPLECVKTNVDGAKNVIDAALDAGVEGVVALSTDKASNPVNLYGATKLVSDKLFVAANRIRSHKRTRFSVVRYGNVMGSRGSVIPFFINLKNSNVNELPITDPRMTRFMITLDEAVKLVWHAFSDMLGGEIYVKKIPSMNIVDIAKAVAPGLSHRIIGIREGEKVHEQMIGAEDAQHTYEYAEHFKILPAIHGMSSDPERIKDGSRVEANFIYDSSNNQQWMNVKELSSWIEDNRNKIGKI